nr:group III truncated hemoglobin [Neoroseomonas terrae]
MTAEVSARTGLTPETIGRFLRAFYGAARVDPLLASAFVTVPDWEAHIAAITRFWCSVALMTGEYHGQPMRAHARLTLTSDHFSRWLALFEAIAEAQFTAEGAAHMIDRARRIARSLELGLVPFDPGAARPPGV